MKDAMITFLSEYYEPLCSVLASDKSLNTLIYNSNWTSWIVFHCFTGTFNNTPPPTPPSELFYHKAVFSLNVWIFT